MVKRGRPFEPGNKLGRGRPPGSGNNKRTRIIQELLDEHATPLLKKALVMAYKEDPQILRLFLDRLLPRPKDPPVRIGPLRMSTAEELLQAHQSLMKKVDSGQLTPSQAQQIDSLIESHRRLMETQQLEKRIRAIERFHSKDKDKAA